MNETIRVIIMADGAGSRWIDPGAGRRTSFGVVGFLARAVKQSPAATISEIETRVRKSIGKRRLPEIKQLLCVDGETLLSRQVRQLRERSVDQIYIASRHKECEIEGAVRYQPVDNVYEIDRFRASRAVWSPGGVTLYLYGDVFYTDCAIDLLLERRDEPWTWYGRWRSFKVTANSQPPEIFGFAFNSDVNRQVSDAIDRVRTEYIEGRVRRCIGWELLKQLDYGDVRAVLPANPPSNFFQILDLTNDFDTIFEYEEWMKVYIEKTKDNGGRMDSDARDTGVSC